MKSVVPIKNVLGFSCYSRVIALKDLLGDDVDVEKLFILSTMYGQAGDDANQMNQSIADSCNWLTSYLMLDTFMSKKDNKALQTVVDTPVEKEDKISQPAVDDTAE